MTDTFTWPLIKETAGGGKFAVTKAQYSDGYAQTAPLGLNSDAQQWNVVWAGYKDDAEDVMAFIRAKQGSESFFWTPPLGVETYWKCVSYDPEDLGGKFYKIAMVFEQDFKP